MEGLNAFVGGAAGSFDSLFGEVSIFFSDSDSDASESEYETSAILMRGSFEGLNSDVDVK